MRRFLLILLPFSLMACQGADEPEATAEPAANETMEEAAAPSSSDTLAAVLDAQPDEVKARYEFRNPQATLEFFGVEPGMTVLEGLPGGGWYTKLLMPYLGSEGKIYGAAYSLEMYPKFSFVDDAYMERMRAWTGSFPAEMQEFRGEEGADVMAFHLGSMPEEIAGTADAVLFIRAMHNLARFRDEGPFLDDALSNAFAVLKPGGVFGIVQHEARAEMPDEWADGSAGYLKKQFVIDTVTAAGFEFVAESDINANPKDQPTTDDIVWRLPPSLATSREDDELRAAMTAIGESNRMTLKFRKPE